jgi:hypothetical protein
MRDGDDEIRVEVELLVVVVELADDLVARGIGEDGVGRAVVQGPAAQREKQTVFERREGRKGDLYGFGPLVAPSRIDPTLTGLSPR